MNKTSEASTHVCISSLLHGLKAVNNRLQTVQTSISPVIAMAAGVQTFFLTACLASLLWTNTASATSSDTEPKGEFLGAIPTVYPDWFKTSFLELEDDVAEAAEAGKRLMLVFHQDGCPYCNVFVERNLAQKDIENRLKKDFDVIEINMWGDREVASVDGQIFTEKTFAAALKVQFTPTVLILNEEGGLALRINGYYHPDKFRLALDYASEKQDVEQSFSDYLASRHVPVDSSELESRSYYTGTGKDIAARSGTKPLILAFEQTGCANCNALHENALASEESKKLLEQFDVYQIDMWGRNEFEGLDGEMTTGRTLANSLNISYAPTLVLYSAEGKEVIRSDSWLKKFHTQSIMDYVASNAWRKQPSFQRFLSERADTLREQGIDVNIWD